MAADLLAALCGAIVGFSLGLVGGGGSILATPLLLYVVGVPDPHVAIGTGALAVAVNAFANFMAHARRGTVRWGNAVLFALVGMLGAVGGATVGKMIDARRLLVLFALLMVAVGVAILRPRRFSLTESLSAVPTLESSAWRVAKVCTAAVLVGALAGFFGIGGGFLIVPGLVFATGMPMINAIGSSLLSVGGFGLATATNYAFSGLVAWRTAAAFIAGGFVGGMIGIQLAIRLAAHRATLNQIFAALIFLVAVYMLYRNVALLDGR